MKSKGILIGKGAFSKVYKINDKEVLIKSVCPVKECVSLYFDKSKYFAPIERLDYQEYKMPFFSPVKSLKESLKPKQYQLYLQLRSLSIPRSLNNYDNLDKWRKEFEKIKDKTLKKDLLMAVDELVNYGQDISFEISPRNVAVKNGNLVLLDCFFSADLLKKLRKK